MKPKLLRIIYLILLFLSLSLSVSLSLSLSRTHTHTHSYQSDEMVSIIDLGVFKIFDELKSLLPTDLQALGKEVKERGETEEDEEEGHGEVQPLHFLPSQQIH